MIFFGTGAFAKFKTTLVSGNGELIMGVESRTKSGVSMLGWFLFYVWNRAQSLQIYLLLLLWDQAYANHNVHVELRGQLVRIRSSLYHVGPGDQSQVVRYGGRCLYSLNHLSSPGHNFLNVFNVSIIIYTSKK